jgi:hypothetical protein
VEKTVLTLLQELNRVYPKRVKRFELNAKGFDETLLVDTCLNGLIRTNVGAKINAATYRFAEETNYDFWLSSAGFTLLTLHDTENTLKKFSKSSDVLSKVLITLTIIIVIFTIILAIPILSTYLLPLIKSLI